MQTKEDCMDKIKEMLPNINKSILEKSERLLNSGGVNFDITEDGEYILPKILLTVVLKSLSEQFEPYTKAQKELAKNLEYF